ncbi:hypothetical protein C5167_031933 [Papaver somniferum]|uniref:Endoglucanase n=1 Tax=Papaver somniferum TaxID=3469 RepID=A0A4Y7K540_PAPSO|nr:endoglucanase 13-like [Papaver somniferum]RZC68473.1 hypothetical protein C5167_031933 [Papaver somniferum]
MHLHTLGFCFSVLLLLQIVVGQADYGTALTKSILYYEAQRSGKLPTTQRVTWRGDSGLKDGSDAGLDLTGGYYDAGDNVKFGFPMAFTITMLSWSVVEYASELEAKNELSNALDAIKWGTDYLLKAHVHSETDGTDTLYGQVGEAQPDHNCWERPEDMDTPRNAYMISAEHPGADLAGETSAAFAAASIVFKTSDPSYSAELLKRATQLYNFARNNHGLYHLSIPGADQFYPSSGFEDELSWAASWLYRATEEQTYLGFLLSVETGWIHHTFCWDNKFTGVQVLMAKLVLEGKVKDSDKAQVYKSNAEDFVCAVIQKGNDNIQMSGGGSLYWQPWNNVQYITAGLFIITVYSDYLRSANSNLNCQNDEATPDELNDFVKSQVDYILGSNPIKMSYMVGMGSNYPQNVHHRGASIVSIKTDSTPVTCKGGYDIWFNKDAPNPNVLEGGLVSSNLQDTYEDSRSNFQQAEPATANTAPLVGVLARLA